MDEQFYDRLNIHPQRIIVKFYDGIDIPPTNDAPTMLEEYQIAPWNELAKQIPGIHIEPEVDADLYQAIQDRLARAEEAEELDPTYQQPAFTNYFVVTIPLDQDPEEVAEYIRESWGDTVDHVYLRPLPAPSPAVTPNDEGDIGQQGYVEAHNPSPVAGVTPTTGVGARYAWEFWGNDGGDGQGVNFIDLENGWHLIHDDLRPIPMIHGVDISTVPAIDLHGLDPNEQKAHGTHTLGVVVADDNADLILGIAANANAAVASAWQTKATPGGIIYEQNISQAILAALLQLEAGDVLLLEVQLPVIGEPDKHDPVELDPNIFNKIRLATAIGITVIEAAGNGKNVAGAADNGAFDLDTRPQLGTGIKILDKSSWPADNPPYDSKAIMVGASTRAYPHQRLVPASTRECIVRPKPSNYGSRVDCYAWGQCVFTIGATNGDPRGFNANYNGTSSASAIVAGVAVIVQAVARQKPGAVRIRPEHLRTILHDNGIPSANPTVDRIGTMPNLQNVIDSALELPDIYIRDYVGDDGEPHNAGLISRSPDIVVLQDTAATLNIDLGSATEHLANLSQDVLHGQPNYVYVRVKNRGSVPANNVTANVYWSLPSTLVTPPWGVVGSVTIPTVPVGNTLTVASPIIWNSAPAPGHYCFVALIGHDDDPAPQPVEFENFDWYMTFIRQNNNAAWCNFNVPDDADGEGAAEMAFFVAGPPDKPRRMHLEVVPRLPRGAKVWLEASSDFMHRLNVDKRRLVHSSVVLPQLQPEDQHALPARGDSPIQQHRFRHVPGFARWLQADIPQRLEAWDGPTVHLPLNPYRVTHFGPVSLRRQERTPVHLRVELPQQLPARGPYEVYVRHLYRGIEVGRITWQFNPQKQPFQD